MQSEESIAKTSRLHAAQNSTGPSGDHPVEWHVERDEFIAGIQDIKPLLGTGNFTDALAQVQSELLLPQCSSAMPEQASGTFLGGQPVADELDSLATRGRVLERMLGYFTTLQETYLTKLQRVHEEQRELAGRQAEEHLRSSVPPPPAHVFVSSGRSPRHEGSDGDRDAQCSDHQSREANGTDHSTHHRDSLENKTGSPEEVLHVELARHDPGQPVESASEFERALHEQGEGSANDLPSVQQAPEEQVSQLQEVGHECPAEYSHATVSLSTETPLADAVDLYRKPDEDDEPQWVDFSDDDGANSTNEKAHIDDNSDGLQEREWDEQDDGQEPARSEVDESQSGVVFEDGASEDEDEVHSAGLAHEGLAPGDLADDDAARNIEELDRHESAAASGVPQMPMQGLASDEEEKELHAATDATEPPQELAIDEEEDLHIATDATDPLRTSDDGEHNGKASLPVTTASAEPPSRTKESAKTKGAPKKVPGATGGRRKEKKRDNTQQADQPAQPSDRRSQRLSQARVDTIAGASSSRASGLQSTQPAPSRTPGTQQSGAGSQASRGASNNSSVSSRPTSTVPAKQQHLPATAADRQQQPIVGNAADVEGLPRSTRRAPWPRLSRDDVCCVQTLELGTSVRSAICIGHEVWTADWSGRVVIRGSEDASKVIAEIPTNKFVWCIMYMEPGLMWMGQESQGIALFDVSKKEFRGTLTGGHVGGVTCLATENGLGDLTEPDGSLPRRIAWSASNDFTIRRWNVQMWRAADDPPIDAAGTGKFRVDLGDWRVSIARGRPMRGHKKGVRVMLQIGPTLWSGGDDGTIRIWRCADDTCTEAIENAHRGAVLKLVIVRSYVWSGGSDGLIKEWSLIGSPRQCLRQVSPEGSEKGIYGLIPLGHDVWTCGHHPMIQVLSQHSLSKTSEHKAHEPWISNLLAVDRVETRIVWSTSLGDRKLKVWRHTIRGFQPTMDELRAACQLFQADEEARAGNESVYIDRASMLEADLTCSSQEYKEHLEKLSLDLAEAMQKSDMLDAQRKGFEEELLRLRSMFETAGLGDVLQSPDAMHSFLKQAVQLNSVFSDPALASMLDNIDELREYLQALNVMKDLLESLGMPDALHNPARLQQFLESAYRVKSLCECHGLKDVFQDPSLLQQVLEATSQLNSLCQSYGLKSVLEDPLSLHRYLQACNKVDAACKRHGLTNIYDDPSRLEQLLRATGDLKRVCEAHGLQNVTMDPSGLASLLSSYRQLERVLNQHGLIDLLRNPGKLNEFLRGHAELELELQDAKEEASRLQLAEERLCDLAVELADANAKLDEFRSLGDLSSILELQQDAEEARFLREARSKYQKELGAMQTALEQKDKERLDALEKLRAMALKYKELDIFKLDVIARELKGLDGELGYVGKAVRELQGDVGKMKHYDEQQQIGSHGSKMHDQCVQLRAHIRDVINKCLSETQKLHIGISVDDHMGAGELQDGGLMGGYFLEEVDVPEHGSSKAARFRQHDELHRDKRLHKDGRPVSLPRIASSPCLPPRAPSAALGSARGSPTHAAGWAHAGSPVPGNTTRGSPTRMSSPRRSGRWSPQ